MELRVTTVHRSSDGWVTLLDLEYDPVANRATLMAHAAWWNLWLARPDGKPGTPYRFSRDKVGGIIGADRLTDVDEVTRFLERTLIEVGYSVRRDDGPFPAQPDCIAVWSLAPGSN